MSISLPHSLLPNPFFRSSMFAWHFMFAARRVSFAFVWTSRCCKLVARWANRLMHWAKPMVNIHTKMLLFHNSFDVRYTVIFRLLVYMHFTNNKWNVHCVHLVRIKRHCFIHCSIVCISCVVECLSCVIATHLLSLCVPCGSHSMRPDTRRNDKALNWHNDLPDTTAHSFASFTTAFFRRPTILPYSNGAIQFQELCSIVIVSAANAWQIYAFVCAVQWKTHMRWYVIVIVRFDCPVGVDEPIYCILLSIEKQKYVRPAYAQFFDFSIVVRCYNDRCQTCAKKNQQIHLQRLFICNHAWHWLWVSDEPRTNRTGLRIRGEKQTTRILQWKIFHKSTVVLLFLFRVRLVCVSGPYVSDNRMQFGSHSYHMLILVNLVIFVTS